MGYGRWGLRRSTWRCWLVGMRIFSGLEGERFLLSLTTEHRTLIRRLRRNRCWEWDVCAGMATLLEAGGFVFDANPPALSLDPLWSPSTSIPLAPLGGRRYLAVRACSPALTRLPTPGVIDSVEKGFDKVGGILGKEAEGRRKEQERVCREVWKRVTGFRYQRPE